MSLWDTVTVTVGADDISNDVNDVDIWAEELFYCSRFEIKLVNEADEWHADFNVSDDVTISVNGTTMFVGYLDDIEEQTGEEGANHSVMVLKGRGTSFYLQNLYHTGNYPDGTYSKADDIIFDALADAQDGLDEAEKITYTSPSTAPITAIKFSKTFLLDAFKELAERTYYNGYVDNSQALHFFPQGDASEHVATNLVLDSNVGNSNILRFLWGEQVGSSIKNYVEFYAGSVKDHWTDYVTDVDGETVWANVTNAIAPVNETYYKLPRGVCSIEIAANTTEALPTTTEFTVGLAFPRFNYTSINLRNDAEGSYWTYNEYPGTTTGYKYIRPQLVDQLGNVIEFVKDLVSTDDLGVTEDIAPFKWTCVKFPMGASITIKSTLAGGYWYYKTTSSTYSVASGAWTNADLDAPTGRMVLSGGTLVPESEFAIGQKIVLSSCENAANDGTYTIRDLGSNYIDVWETIDVDNDTDTTMVLAAGFDWEHVEAIRIHCGYQAVAAVKPKVYIDYLTLPQVAVISLQESAGSSVLYKKRMYRESHPEVINQNQLDEMAEAYLVRYKDPLSILRVTTMGQTGTLYAGQSLDVQAVPYGINALTKYRITKLHHKIAERKIFKNASNFITEYDLIEHSIGGATVYSDSYRVNSFYNPQLTSIDRLKDFRDRLSIDDTTDDVHTYSRIPGDGDLSAVFTTGLYADIPASAVTDTFYYATDTMVWWRWTGSAWVEATRAEVKIRLAQISERAHSSTSGVSSDQHHNRSHGSRHDTAAGADPLDTQSDGSHSHTTNDTTGWVGTYGAGGTVYAHLTSDPASGLTAIIGHSTGADISIVQSLNTAGAHTHDVTTSPTEKVEVSEDDPMIIIHEDKFTPDGHRVMDITFVEFNHRETITFPATRTEGQILKNIKQHWHDLWNYTSKNKNLLKSTNTLTGKKLRWDRDFEKKHMLESSLDDGLDGWRSTMEETIKDGRAHPDDVLQYRKHLKDRNKKRKDLGLDDEKPND